MKYIKFLLIFVFYTSNSLAAEKLRMIDRPSSKKKDTIALLAMHAEGVAERQAMLAENVANANTPAYRAKDIDLSQISKGIKVGGIDMRTTNSKHILSSTKSRKLKTHFMKGNLKPNGNDVDLPIQMARVGETSDKYNEIIKSFVSSAGLISAASGAN
jgi:flagellar basal-body rod protein FlgB